MSRIIRLIDNETIEISDYRNSGYLFDNNAPTIEDIRKQISNIDDWCCFKETINPFVLYGEKEELQHRISKAIEYIENAYEEEYHKPKEVIKTFNLKNCTYEPSLVVLGILKGEKNDN